MDFVNIENQFLNNPMSIIHVQAFRRPGLSLKASQFGQIHQNLMDKLFTIFNSFVSTFPDNFIPITRITYMFYLYVCNLFSWNIKSMT